MSARILALACAAGLSSLSLAASAAQPSALACVALEARNPQEAAMMRASQGRDGCWARNPNSDKLGFVSRQSPDKTHKRSLNSPAATASPARSINAPSAHGASNPALFGRIAGTWAGTWCGLNVGTLTLSTSGNALQGSITSREMVMNQDVTSCKALNPHFVGQPVTLSLRTLGFDGHVLFGSASGSVDNQQKDVPLTLTLVGDTLVLAGD